MLIATYRLLSVLVSLYMRSDLALVSKSEVEIVKGISLEISVGLVLDSNVEVDVLFAVL